SGCSRDSSAQASRQVSSRSFCVRVHGVKAYWDRLVLPVRLERRNPTASQLVRERLPYQLNSFSISPQKSCPDFSTRCSRIGPRLSTGKNVRAPRMTITLVSRPVNSGVFTGNVPGEGGTLFFLARFP